jgi:hypothetical protein
MEAENLMCGLLQLAVPEKLRLFSPRGGQSQPVLLSVCG